MGASPNVENYTLGKGIPYFDEQDQTTLAYKGLLDLGNCNELNMVVDITKLDHFSQRGGIRAKDLSIVQEISIMLTMILDEVNVENMKLFTFSESESISQVEASDITDTIETAYQGRHYILSKRNVSIVKLNYDGGTVDFTVGQTLTGAGGANAKIIAIDGDTTSGILYLGKVTSGPFVNDEAITDDGGTPGAAVANGAETELTTDVLVTNTAGDNIYALTTDYMLSSNKLYIVVDGNIADASEIKVHFNCGAATYDTLTVLAKTKIEGRFRFQSHAPQGEDRELDVWRLSLSPTGDMGFISDEIAAMTLEGEVLKDETGHPTSPYMNIYMNEVLA